MLRNGLIVLGVVLGLIAPAGAQVAQQFTPSHSVASVTNTTGLALAANANRGFLMLQNDDAALVVYCAFGAAAVLNTGIRIQPVGAVTIIFSPIIPLGALNCLTTAAGPAKLLITEGSR